MVARLIILVPMILILLIVGLVIYLIAQAKYSPNRAKVIVIKVSLVVNLIIMGFFLFWALYSLIDKNMLTLEFALSLAAIPAIALVITLICRTVFYKHHPKFKHEAKKTSRNESFAEFWKKRIIKFLTEFISGKMPK